MSVSIDEMKIDPEALEIETLLPAVSVDKVYPDPLPMSS